MKRRVYCLAVMESLSPVASLESFRATLTKNLSNDCCFCLLFRISALSRQTSSTRTANHRSFIKLKFLQNFCSSCKTLANKVARNPRFYCIHFFFFPFGATCRRSVQKTSKYYTTEFHLEKYFKQSMYQHFQFTGDKHVRTNLGLKRGAPLMSGAWGCRPTCHPQTPAMVTL
jgi:hypothetical protein